MVQATVAAHISAICTGALRHRDEIIGSKTRAGARTPQAKEGLIPIPKLPDSTCRAAAAADGGEHCVQGRAGAVQACGDRGGSANGDPAGLLQQKEKGGEDHGHHVVEHHDGEGGEEESEGSAAPATAPSSPGTDPTIRRAPTMTTTTPDSVVPDDDDGGHNEDWWEEDDEGEQEQEGGGGARPGAAVAGLNKLLWMGAAARTGAGEGGRKEGAAGGRQWIHRREREAPFLRLLVSSQVYLRL